jgi:hypothetical protein
MNARKAAPRQPPPVKPQPGPLSNEEEIDARDPAERIVSHPDGYYWQALDGRQEIGPFATLAEALADMDSGDASGWVPGETLAEAESEIGVSDWIDADSGALAEGQAHTHLERE